MENGIAFGREVSYWKITFPWIGSEGYKSI